MRLELASEQDYDDGDTTIKVRLVIAGTSVSAAGDPDLAIWRFR